MQYMLLIYGDPTADAPPDAPDGVFADWETATRVLRNDGALVAGDPLAGIDTATTIRARGRDRLVTDGPRPLGRTIRGRTKRRPGRRDRGSCP